ncbi:MAG: ATP-grasp domain-containing protein, partial [Gammaproteobacteria bacterium]|nr:ATP-grasp domain-containing protein [Gammaproteobacteria bacterium]
KRAGFSDLQIARICGSKEDDVAKARRELGITPFIRQIDTLAAEYPARTNYLYLTYNGVEDDIPLSLIREEEGGNPSYIKNTVIILGSGAYRIGSSVEFDWCCVNAGAALREMGYHTVMLNYNPETVSTDYDEFDKLIFDEISFETIREIYAKLHPLGIIVSMGGQIPNNLALRLHQAGLKVLGTSPENIDRAENRSVFSSLLDSLDIGQPVWKELASFDSAIEFAAETGYPVLVRPSYVLSGAAMAVASNDMELSRYLQRAVDISPKYPTVISQFLENAKEIEMDAVAANGEIIAYAISEHVENAGIHSGDATLVLPPQRINQETIRQIRRISKKIVAALEINGPFNIQFIAKHNEVRVIECNLRASRSFPFVSKILKQNFITLATRVIMGKSAKETGNLMFELNCVGVKAPQFSFTRLVGADPVSGVEMASTGEAGCLGDNFHEAFLKALMSVGYRFPIQTILLSAGPIESKAELLESIRILTNMGVKFYATKGTAKFMEENSISMTELHWPLEKQQPNSVDYIKQGKIDLVINIPKNFQEDELTNDYIIRRTTVDYNVMLITNRQIAMRLTEALVKTDTKQLPAKSWQAY